jgi:hypothetical protein
MNVRSCEVCGAHFLEDYGYSLLVQWTVTGHAALGAFLCPSSEGTGQHWGCTAEHALEAALACASRHMHPELQARHAEMTRRGISRLAEEHQALFDEQDMSFHILSEEAVRDIQEFKKKYPFF